MRKIDRDMLKEISGIIESFERIILKGEGLFESEEMSRTIEDTIKTINLRLYNAECINISSLDHSIDIDYLKALINTWKLSLSTRKGISTDIWFWMLFEYFSYVDRVTIISNSVHAFEERMKDLPEEYREAYSKLPEMYSFMSDRIDMQRNDISLIENNVDMIKGELEKFKWLYFKLADYRSKEIMLHIIDYWFFFDIKDISDRHENIYGDYYDYDIIKPVENGVFTDCGAFIGDTVKGYIDAFGDNYKRIYAYEISPFNYEILRSNTERYRDVTIKQKGVGKCPSTLFLDEECEGGDSRLTDHGKLSIEVVALDDDISEKIDLLKMDIEGAEKEALLGAQRHIKEENPELLICTYHNASDLFEIPWMINDFRDDYSFYLRYNGTSIWPCDHVLFAV